MRLSRMLFVTLREDPAFIGNPQSQTTTGRRLHTSQRSGGIYAYLPLMWRVLQEVSQIVRDQMNATGATECLLPH
jgi:prolyl-tRNA synthetase